MPRKAKQRRFDVYVVLWSRTQFGHLKLINAHRTERRAKSEARLRSGYYGGWHHVAQYEPVGDFTTITEHAS
jgi:hypothetical protein